MIPLSKNDNAAEAHFTRVKGLIQDRINSIFKRGISMQKTKITFTRELRNYLKSLLSDKELKVLIMAGPHELRGIIEGIRNGVPELLDITHPSFHVIENIFINHCYNIFDKSDLISTIPLDTCAYCNRSYIYSLPKADIIKPELDHFYPKTKFPFLGVSFYNLIPSCQTCNGIHVKGQKDPTAFDLTNPYALAKDSFLFTYKINSIDVLNPLNSTNAVSVIFDKMIQGHLDVFKLDKLYALHNDHALELVLKSQLDYSDVYRKYLESYTNLEFSQQEIDRMILGTYSDDSETHKRPLAKLYQDLGKELGLIKEQKNRKA